MNKQQYGELVKYSSYEKYIKHQLKGRHHPGKKKSTFPIRDKRIESFYRLFSLLDLPEKSSVLCIGARFGEEVVAASKIFDKVIGIDLSAYPPLVIEGDMHDLEFKDNEFNLVYTNCIDHSCDPLKVFSEIRRVLCKNGTLVLDVSSDEYGLKPRKWTSFTPKSFESLLEISQMCLVKKWEMSKKERNGIIGMNERIILRNNK